VRCPAARSLRPSAGRQPLRSFSEVPTRTVVAAGDVARPAAGHQEGAAGMTRYAGSRAVVVGQATAIGPAIAKRLVEGGAEVLLTGRTAQERAHASAERGSAARVVAPDAVESALGPLGGVRLAFADAVPTACQLLPHWTTGARWCPPLPLRARPPCARRPLSSSAAASASTRWPRAASKHRPAVPNSCRRRGASAPPRKSPGRRCSWPRTRRSRRGPAPRRRRSRPPVAGCSGTPHPPARRAARRGRSVRRHRAGPRHPRSPGHTRPQNIPEITT
jgi:hypothetical protein